MSASALLVGAGMVLASATQDTTPAGDPPAASQMSPEEAAMMEKWGKYAEVGPEQKWLASWAGEYTATVEISMTPDAPPVTHTGSATYESMYGGRFLKQTYRGQMGPGGPPFEGTGYLCFDNARQQFLHIWFDSVSSGWSSGVGTGGSAVGRIDWVAVEPDIMKGGSKPSFGMQTATPDTLVLESYDQAPTAGAKPTMRITYMRKK